MTDKHGKTTLRLNAKAAASFKGRHSAGYNLLTTAIASKSVATVEMWNYDSLTTTYVNGNSTVHLDRDVTGADRVTPMVDPAHPGKDENPFSIIAGHELLGHALLNMLHDPGANEEGPGSPVWGVEQTLGKEQGLMPRPDLAP